MEALTKSYTGNIEQRQDQAQKKTSTEKVKHRKTQTQKKSNTEKLSKGKSKHTQNQIQTKQNTGKRSVNKSEHKHFDTSAFLKRPDIAHHHFSSLFRCLTKSGAYDTILL